MLLGQKSYVSQRKKQLQGGEVEGEVKDRRRKKRGIEENTCEFSSSPFLLPQKKLEEFLV